MEGMNKEDIIRMAKEAEAWSLVDHDGIAALERFANLVAAAEREACAALCDKISDEDGFEGGYADRCAFTIRERGAP